MTAALERELTGADFWEAAARRLTDREARFLRWLGMVTVHAVTRVDATGLMAARPVDAVAERYDGLWRIGGQVTAYEVPLGALGREFDGLMAGLALSPRGERVLAAAVRIGRGA